MMVSGTGSTPFSVQSMKAKGEKSSGLKGRLVDYQASNFQIFMILAMLLQKKISEQQMMKRKTVIVIIIYLKELTDFHVGFKYCS